ncbi:8-oxo-dGDP phosphatase NUDT18 isoform X2 [Patella vulgata]|uniref:8-oxo-dGDP phosphatase NUDT18 isoform X2 n=1 Tax=Patella vulgata TaxID=6465 RepID=UPI00217FA953|nr:8-oxo-dGDP phosphatase NUDT18 isoform X2 [Patella vulgata]
MDETLIKLFASERILIDGVDVTCTNAAEFIPRTKRNMGYIVGGLVFNDKDEILMMQEAKRSCHGKWYLPMGRLEPGGVLKTKPDEESLKADWFNPGKVLNKEITLRKDDILRIIQKGIEYQKLPKLEQPNILPVVHPHIQILHRVILHTLTPEGDHAILVNTNKNVHLPCCVMGPEDISLMVSIFLLFKDVFGRLKHPPEICGIVSVEHCGQPEAKNDGMCLTSLVHTKNVLKFDGVNKKNYDWHVVTDTDLISKLNLMLAGKKILPFFDVNSGVLKTKPDEESLKADWFNPGKVLNKEITLRKDDILRIIQKGIEYQKLPKLEQPNILPVVHPHIQILHRVILHTLTPEGDHAILVNTNKNVHLPCCVMGPEDISLMVSIFLLFKDVFGRLKHPPEICGIVSVEHCGQPEAKNDGMCLTSLVHTKNVLKFDGVNKKNYDWHVVTDTDLISKLNLMLAGKKILPFFDVNSKTR